MTTQAFTPEQIERFKGEIITEAVKHLVACKGQVYSGLDSFFDWISGPADGVDPAEYWGDDRPEWIDWPDHEYFAGANWFIAEKIARSKDLNVSDTRDQWYSGPYVCGRCNELLYDGFIGMMLPCVEITGPDGNFVLIHRDCLLP